jgi:hypothetical protein
MNWEEEQRQRALANQREREADAERKRDEAGRSVSSVQGDQISRKIKQINEDKKATRAQPTFVVGKAVLGAKKPPGIAAGPETPASTQYHFPWDTLVGALAFFCLFFGIIRGMPLEAVVRNFLIGATGIGLLAVIAQRKWGQILIARGSLIRLHLANLCSYSFSSSNCTETRQCSTCKITAFTFPAPPSVSPPRREK